MNIPQINRELARITYMSMRKGTLELGEVELHLIRSLLIRNLDFVRKMDELNNLSFLAYAMNDMEWQHDICRRIDELGNEELRHK